MQRVSKTAAYHAGMRAAVTLLLGNVCVKCAEVDRRVLQIDHVKGGGSAFRRGAGARIHSIIRLIRKHGLKHFQLLCANCNQRKRHTHKER